MSDLLLAYSPTVLLVLALAGLGIGVVGGLLGIGGGVIAVPVLLDVLAAAGVAEPARLPLAVGTAHLVVALAAVPAVWGHARAGTLDRPILRAWTPAVLAGGLAGLLVSPLLAPRLSLLLFALVVAALALRMALGPRAVLAYDLPKPPAGLVPPGLVGALAAALGIGAGTLSGPMLGLFGVPLGRAVGAGAAFNLVVAAPAALNAAAAGHGATGDAVGQVALAAAGLLALPAMAAAPFAARLAGRLPERVLRLLFVLCLLAIAARVLAAVVG